MTAKCFQYKHVLRLSVVYVSNEISSNGLYYSRKLKTKFTAEESLYIMLLFANSLCFTLFLLLFAIICITFGCAFDKLVFCLCKSLQNIQFMFCGYSSELMMVHLNLFIYLPST